MQKKTNNPIIAEEHMINKAFAELAVDIDYPMNKWKVDSIEGYLNYTLSLLELLNSMSSSLSHPGHAGLFQI